MDYPQRNWTAKCPVCTGAMAEGNKFCCYRCYEQDLKANAEALLDSLTSDKIDMENDMK